MTLLDVQPLSILAGERGDGEAIEADGDEEDAREFSLRQAKSNDPASPLMRLVSTFVNTAVSLKLQPTEADFRELLQARHLHCSSLSNFFSCMYVVSLLACGDLWMLADAAPGIECFDRAQDCIPDQPVPILLHSLYS